MISSSNRCVINNLVRFNNSLQISGLYATPNLMFNKDCYYVQYKSLSVNIERYIRQIFGKIIIGTSKIYFIHKLIKQ